jgi:hypothetical protein
MTPGPDTLDSIAKAIQLALAPVFLLTGIAGMLNVMTNRLSRIIDRGRQLTEGQLTEGQHGAAPSQPLSPELETLERRRHLTSVAITASTIAALLVCIVIAALFAEVLLNAHLKWFIGALFTIAMLVLVVGLAFFLREVHLAMKSLLIPKPRGK